MTSGWIAGFGLALQMLEESPDLPTALAAARELSYQYLGEHVYRSLTDDERRLLEFSMLLPQIDVELLERAGFTDAAVTLDRLFKRVMFLSVDPREFGKASPRLYRCHDLLRDYLQHQLHLRDEGTRTTLYYGAARVLQASGKFAEALKLYALARSYESVVSLLRERGFELLEQAHGDAIATSIELLPDAERSQAIVLGLSAQQETDAGHFDRAKVLFERALAAPCDLTLRAILVERMSLALVNSGTDASNLLESVAALPDIPTDVRASVLSLLAVSQAHFGHADRAKDILLELEPMVSRVDSVPVRAWILQRIGGAAHFIGDDTRARRALEEAKTLALRSGALKTAYNVYGLLGTLATQVDDDIASATRYAELQADAATKAGIVHGLWNANFKRICLALLRGDRALVQELLPNMVPSLSSDTRSAGTAFEIEGMLAAWDGDFSRAHVALVSACECFYVLEEERALHRAFAAFFAIAAGKRDAALELVAKANDDRRKAKQRGSAFVQYSETARLLCGLTLALAGKRRIAQQELRGKPLATTPFVIALRELVATVVRDVEQGVATDRVAPYLEAMRSHNYGGYADVFERTLRVFAPRNAPDLTPAEVRILRLLAAGGTPKDIALETGTSVHTIRTHIKRTIAKFGCSGRNQVVQAARARGII